MSRVKSKGIDFSGDPGRTVQYPHAGPTDIGSIVARFTRTGTLPDGRRQGQYIDVSSYPDFQSAMQTVADAQDQFAALPSNVRAYFRNDPAAPLRAIDDPTQAQALVDLGLAVKRPSTPSNGGVSAQQDVGRNPAGGEGPRS